MDNLTNQQINQGLYRPLQAGTLYAPYIPASDCSSKLLGRGDTSFAITNMQPLPASISITLSYLHYVSFLHTNLSILSVVPCISFFFGTSSTL